MVARNVIKYLKVYRTLFKYSLIDATTYKVSFFIELFVELGYDTAFVIFFAVIFGNVHQIAGWSYNEILFLAGLNIVTSEWLLGLVMIFGLWQLPDNIKNGDVDIALLKPINSLFNLSLSKPYFTSIISVIPGFLLMFFAATRMHLGFNPFNILLGTVLVICGLIIGYSVFVIVASLSFRFTGASTLPRVGEKLIVDYKSNPLSAYQGALRAIMLFVVPAVFVSSVPASTILRGPDYPYVIWGIVLAAVFLTLAIKIWNTMINYYSSASS